MSPKQIGPNERPPWVKEGPIQSISQALYRRHAVTAALHHWLMTAPMAAKLGDGICLDGAMAVNRQFSQMLLREITVMDACSHPHLVRLYEVVEIPTRIHLVLQLAPGGELFTKLTEQGKPCLPTTAPACPSLPGKYPEARARAIFVQVASAISYLHDNGMIHRDLKAENVFFTGRDEVVVGDFGFATRVESMEQVLPTTPTLLPSTSPPSVAPLPMLLLSCL